MAGKDDKVEELIKSGDAKFDAGDFEGSINDYTEAVNFNPADKSQLAEAYRDRGFAKNKLGRREEAIADFDEAIRLCDEAIEIDSENARAWYNRGFAKSGLGRHEEAIADYDEAIRLDPEFAPAWNGRGFAKDKLGRKEEAIADFDEAIRLDSEFASAWNNLGAAKHGLGRHEEAIADYDEAIRLNPKNAASWNNRGLAKYRLGKYEEAIADYNEAIRLDPKNTTALNNRAAVETQNAIRDSVGEGVNEIKKAEEFKKQAEEYERREKINRRWAYVAMVGLAGLIVFLVATLIVPNLPSEYFPKLLPECSPESKSECLPELKPVDIKNLFNLLPLITLMIIITSPLVWTIRLLIAAANKAELMRAEYRHLALVERRMFVYFAEDDTDEGKQIRADYIKATMTNSPADKLVALQNKANAPSPNFVETIRSKIIGKSSS